LSKFFDLLSCAVKNIEEALLGAERRNYFWFIVDRSTAGKTIFIRDVASAKSRLDWIDQWSIDHLNVVQPKNWFEKMSTKITNNLSPSCHVPKMFYL
jgi:hypothetical protein